MQHGSQSSNDRIDFDSGVMSSSVLRRVHRHARHSIYVGIGPGGWSWAGAQRATLVLGPPRSGKTSSLVIPNILLSDGAVVSTSTKPDVMAATAAARQREGWTFLYDPSGEVECPRGVERIGWSPLTSAATWDAAVQTADAMVGASRAGSPSPSEHHWNERAGALLSTLLHAAAAESLAMPDVLRWIDRHDATRPLEILAATSGADSTPTDLLAGIVATDSREQSGIWSTASGVLAAYRTESAMASTEAAAPSWREFCDGPNTLYVCATGRRQRQFAPLVVATVGDVRDAAYERSHHPSTGAGAGSGTGASTGAGSGTGASTGTGAPVLLALDEVANIAPIPDLPAMVSEGASQGLLVLACLQDLSQARARWGTAADGFLSLFGTTVVLPGIADTTTLRDLSALAGERTVRSETLSRSVGSWGRIRPSTTLSSSREPRMPVDSIARGHPGRAHVLGPDKAMAEVELTPAHARSPWRDLVNTTWEHTRAHSPSRGEEQARVAEIGLGR
jgi:type IV secretion system protein VirD4